MYRPGWHISRLTPAPKPKLRPEVKKIQVPEPQARSGEDQLQAEASLDAVPQTLAHASNARVQRRFPAQRRVASEHKKLEAAQSMRKVNARKKEHYSRRQSKPDERQLFAMSIGLATLLFFRLTVPMGYMLIAFVLLLVAGGMYKRRYLTMNGWNWTILPTLSITRRQLLTFITGLSIVLLTWLFPVSIPFVWMLKIAVGGFWVVRQAVMMLRKEGSRRNPLTRPNSAFWNHWTGKRWNRLGYSLQALMFSSLLAGLSFIYFTDVPLPLFDELLVLAVPLAFILFCCVLLLEAGKRVLGNEDKREAQKQADPNQGGKTGEKFLTHKVDRLVVFCLAALVVWFLWQLFAYGVLGYGVGGMFVF